MNYSVRKITAENSDLLQKVLGTFDENLNVIMRELGVTVRVDGLTVVITGDEDTSSVAAGVVENLLKLALSG